MVCGLSRLRVKWMSDGSKGPKDQKNQTLDKIGVYSCPFCVFLRIRNKAKIRDNIFFRYQQNIVIERLIHRFTKARFTQMCSILKILLWLYQGSTHLNEFDFENISLILLRLDLLKWIRFLKTISHRTSFGETKNAYRETHCYIC